jgi:outer membrane protein assembly factor BamD (BamD/ComL family)
VTQPIAEHKTGRPDQATQGPAMSRVCLRWLAAFLVAVACSGLTGCAGDKMNLTGKDGPEADPDNPAQKDKEESGFDITNIKAPWHWDMFKPKAPPAPADSLVLRGDGLEQQSDAKYGKAGQELAGAKDLFRKGDYAKAEVLFHFLAENKRNPPQLAEEARYYEAESLRLQKRYPKAADTYVKMLNDFPSGAYREQALQHVFDIANYWLDDTRQEMAERREKEEGKRWLVSSHFVNWDKSKPFLDEEGRAVEKLEQVRYNDMTGPLADKALFLLGSVKFFDGDYREAEHYFSQLVEMHPNSDLAQQSVELGIISKNLATGGPDYDGRKSAEARQLVHTALNNYPKLASEKKEFFERQIECIALQQADKDYRVAEFYRRTGHPEAAYFYYEIVRRRYPGSKYAERATQQMSELRAKADKQHPAAPPEPQRPATPPGKEPAAPSQPAPAPPETAPAPRPFVPPVNPPTVLPPVAGMR